ncbi:MAG: metalloprotease PmbA, partial [Gammaproteobacteria bacterium]|nr:metalloprotease PmbA [Gammaproteobacteria bacterium]
LAKDVPDLELYQPWDLSPEQAVEMARECEAAGMAVDNRISNSEGAYISTHSGQRVYGNSLGFVGGYSSSRHSIGCTLIASGDDEMQRDYWYSVSRNPNRLEDLNDIGRQAGERTVRRLNAQKLGTRKVPVIFTADVARGLMGHLVRAVSGGALYRQSSFLLDAIDKKLFPDFVEMDERPHLIQGLGSAPFDTEGVATQARKLIESGVLQSYVLDSYAARRLKLQSTGNAGGVHNLFINSTGQSFEELLQQMNTGLLVTEVMGQGVNIVTGDYSRGASGFWVENGEIQYPVEEITIASTLPQMFQGLLAVGNDMDQRGNLVSGSWLINEITVAGN